jgi:hypothetical protein
MKQKNLRFVSWIDLQPGSHSEKCLERFVNIEDSVFYSILRDGKIDLEEFYEIFTVFANHPRGPNFPYEAQCSALYRKMRKALVMYCEEQKRDKQKRAGMIDFTARHQTCYYGYASES